MPRLFGKRKQSQKQQRQAQDAAAPTNGISFTKSGRPVSSKDQTHIPSLTSARSLDSLKPSYDSSDQGQQMPPTMVPSRIPIPTSEHIKEQATTQAATSDGARDPIVSPSAYAHPPSSARSTASSSGGNALWSQRTIGEKAPFPRRGFSAALHSTGLYWFGGKANNLLTNELVRLDVGKAQIPSNVQHIIVYTTYSHLT